MNKPHTHIDWLVDTGKRVQAEDGKEIPIWEFKHQTDDETLSSWATHFRNHYCLDGQIDLLKGRKTRSDYLTDIKFPSKTSKLGPGIRAGDFGEILVADYLEWILGHWVPRFRWGSKMIRDESSKGCDVIGFYFNDSNEFTPQDILSIYETKTRFSKKKENRLQDAVNDSAKDSLRIDESLNYIKQKFIDGEEFEGAKRVERFQSPVDSPYLESYGAVAIYSEEFYDEDTIKTSNSGQIPKSKKSKEVITHPNQDQLRLLVIKGEDMMALTHELYRRAADEA